MDLSKNINHQSDRRWVIADIHGCLVTFRTLVEEKIKLDKSDQLFLLGDYINRGPDSAGVVDLILDWQRQGYLIYPLRGNHEQMLLENERSGRNVFDIFSFQSVKKKSLRDSNGKTFPHYLEFFTSLPFYYDLGDFYLSHAGLNFSLPNPLLDLESMLWVRNQTPDLMFLGEKKLVHGHTVTHLQNIIKSVEEKKPVIPLDNGCYTGLQHFHIHTGNLCALNLDTYQLIVQPNLDKA